MPDIADREIGEAPLRIGMVDPSNFTIPYDLELVDALGEQGCDVRLICRSERDDERRVALTGAVRHYYRVSERLQGRRALGQSAHVAKGLEHLVDTFRLIPLIRRLRLDCLHFQWLPLPLIDEMAVRVLSKHVPVVHTVHDTVPLLGTHRSGLQQVGWFRALQSFRRLIVHSDASRDRLLACGLDAGKIRVIPHPVLPLADPEGAGLAKRHPEWWRADVRLLLFGHLKPYKGIVPLLEALADLRSLDVGDLHLLLAGRSAFSDGWLEAEVGRRGLAGRVSVDARFLPDGELAALIEHSDVLLFPYLEIDASGALLSSLQSGKALVVSSLPSFDQILEHGTSAWFVPPGDVAALARALEILVSDSDLRARLGAGALSVAQGLPTWEDSARQVLAVYRELID